MTTSGPSSFAKIAAACLMLAALLSARGPFIAAAQTVDELQKQIADRNERLKSIRQEISQYQSQLQQTSKQASSLSSAIKTLDLTDKKLSSELRLTETDIGVTELTLVELEDEILRKQDEIERNMSAIAETLRDIQQSDQTSVIETLLTKPDLASAWTEIDAIASFQSEIRDRIKELRGVQSDLEDKHAESAQKKERLVSLKSALVDKRVLVEQNKRQKASLLTQTKSKETEYKTLLAQKKAEEAAFARELFTFESQLKLVIDKSKIASAAKGVLAWPLDNVRITQYFGRTVDAARLYTSGTHNGIDLAAPVGTPLKAALSGVVEATGNTDEQPGCYSYGKWVLIRHANGLSTLYAHMSLIKAVPGQTVATGELIGYTGNTGYATGPHLHLTVYATQGVRVQRYSHSVSCKNVSIPIADVKAYLDPMQYL